MSSLPRASVASLLDTPAVVDLELLDASVLPAELAIGTPTLAELAAGPHATDDILERAARQARLQWAEAQFGDIPFDVACGARVRDDLGSRSSGWAPASPPSRRSANRGDRLGSWALVVVTRNADDFAGLEGLVDILAV